LSMLERNADLLAEVCVLLIFAGAEVPEARHTWLTTHHADAFWTPNAAAADEYHEYFMCDWYRQLIGKPAFQSYTSTEQFAVHMTRYPVSPLRTLSESLLSMDRRINDGQLMRKVTVDLPDDVYEVVAFAAQSSPYFGRFLANFARSEASVQFS